MTQSKPEKASPNVPSLLHVLATHQVRFVIVGSVAAQLYGAEVQPGDFDITPALDPDNLIRLAKVLLEIVATWPDTDEAGEWQVQANGEKKWVSRKATPEEIRKRSEWLPNPDDISTLDALFYTRYGNFDIVPELAGTYEALMKRARRMQAHAQEVWVAHVDELLATLTIPRRSKDVSRVRTLREIQRHLAAQLDGPRATNQKGV